MATPRHPWPSRYLPSFFYLFLMADVVPFSPSTLAWLGREQKIAVEKKQAYYQPQVNTGNARRIGRWFWVTTHWGRWPVKIHWSGTWVVRGASVGSGRRFTCNQVAGAGPALFPPLFFAPSLLGHHIVSIWYNFLWENSIRDVRKYYIISNCV